MDCLRTELRFGCSTRADQTTVGNPSRSCERQITHSDQVVGGSREGKHPTDPGHAAMASFAQCGDGFEPAEDFFDSFALALTNRIAGTASSAIIDHAGWPARNMRSGLVIAQLSYKLFTVVALVRAQRDPTAAWNLFHHRQRGLRFGLARGLSQARVDHQPIAVLHQHVSEIAKLCRLAFGLLVQPRLGVGRRLMSGVGASFAMKINARIAWMIRLLGYLVTLPFEPLVPRPRLDERAVHREMLVREQPLGTGVGD